MHLKTPDGQTAIVIGSDPLLNKFLPSSNFKLGQQLRTRDDQIALVVGGSVPAAHDGWMWDLTVPGNNDHDFYVAATVTDAPVLVHNECTVDYTGSQGLGRILSVRPP